MMEEITEGTPEDRYGRVPQPFDAANRQDKIIP